MGDGVRTLYIGLDACDLDVAQRFAADGSMPTVARLLETVAVQETLGPLGFLVGSNWVTSYTGVSPSRHQFLCSGQIRGGTYEPRWVGPFADRPAVWEWVSRAGGRVAVLDAPHAALAHELNGVQLVEWGCHDRHGPTQSFPASFLDDINAKHGPHPLGTRAAPFPHHAPCDASHRAGPHRTRAENQVLLDEILEGIRRKAAVSIDLLEHDDWDLFFTVFGESHCAGHQFWKMHDSNHPWHDAEEARALGGDPLRTVYSHLDRALGQVLERAGTDTTVYVHLSHGMRAHYDGTSLLDPVLCRLDEYASQIDLRGSFTRAVDRAVNAVPPSSRRRALTSLVDLRRRAQSKQGPIGTAGRLVDVPAWIGQRRWWMQPNDSVYGSIRLNLEGREPNGRLVGSRKRDVAEWLAGRLLELVNVETGAPAVAAMYYTDDHYERMAGDPLGDLIVEWNRDALISTVWSPATGVVSAPYSEWRTGDHDRRGLLLAAGPGITPGKRSVPISVMDVAPILAASLNVAPPEIDGVARPDLLPDGASVPRPSAHLRRSRLHESPMRLPRRRAYATRAFDVAPDRWNTKFSVGLSEGLHGTHLEVGELQRDVAALRADVSDLERLASIAEVTAWLHHVEVPETMLVSVVMPTRNRVELLERAVESVQRQAYANWELLVVDDASTDETSARLAKLAENDPRVRTFRFADHVGSSIARNHGLDHATGDVIVHLDDDNRFDPDWLRAVVWAFTEYPDTRVCYGARVVDDDARHQGRAGRSMPFVQFLAWDRADMLRANRVDQNVIAHRPSAARLDDIATFNDWDFMLQLTDDGDPLELPVIAAHYYSDAPDRMAESARRAGVEDGIAERVRNRARQRRGDG